MNYLPLPEKHADRVLVNRIKRLIREHSGVAHISHRAEQDDLVLEGCDAHRVSVFTVTIKDVLKKSDTENKHIK